ncbi:MAG: hypothetical protein H0V01_10155 [Bacteroidetes bacterium]|nr:hypothetical protein [Bacteroidota bacterium]HET6245975.1 hypothetical protein [Bacteroidia bacterium]
MKPAVIKKLTEEQSLDTLIKAEEDMLEEKLPLIEIEGDDEGERLTHVMAAIWILKDMEKNKTDYRTSLRNYMGKVRKSIS